MNPKHYWISALALCSLVAAFNSADRLSAADEKKSDRKIEMGEGKVVVTAPESWVRKEPRSRIVEHEFAVPAAKGDTEDGRITVMGAGGSVTANIDRWIGQFKQPDGSETKNQIAEADRKLTVSGIDVHKVDLNGTYHDAARPFDPQSKAVDREHYRMLAAIIVTPKSGSYFIKFYGPSKTVAEHADEFWKAIGALEAKEK